VNEQSVDKLWSTLYVHFFLNTSFKCAGTVVEGAVTVRCVDGAESFVVSSSENSEADDGSTSACVETNNRNWHCRDITSAVSTETYEELWATNMQLAIKRSEQSLETQIRPFKTYTQRVSKRTCGEIFSESPTCADRLPETERRVIVLFGRL
jgi:hypothetical protein